MRKAILILPLLASATVCLAQGTPKLKVGDPAPPIKVSSWVKGSPVKSFAKGKIYVVEFWATWCGPCRDSIPHLTELAKKYKGKVTFNGVSVFERGEGIPAKVDKFVKDMGDKMSYNVALDDGQSMATSWMIAAGQNGIPTAFIVGKKGTIDWIGHPMLGLDEALGQILAGTFDPKAAAAEREKKEAEQAKLREIMKPANEAAAKQDWKAATEELDKVMAAHPEMQANLAPIKLSLLLRQKADERVFAYAKELGDGLYRDDPTNLNQVAWMLVDDQTPLKTRNYDLVVSLASRAVELTKEGDPSMLDTLSYAYFKKGDLDMAIATQEKAVALLGKADVPQPVKDEIDKHMAEYKAAKAKG